jgi:hypothetical protein
MATTTPNHTTSPQGHDTIDTARLPRVSTATKMVASFAAILFSICAFILPNATGRLVTAVVAVAFAVVAILRPSAPRVGLKLLAWLAGAFAAAALIVALVDVLGAGPTPSPQVGP